MTEQNRVLTPTLTSFGLVAQSDEVQLSRDLFDPDGGSTEKLAS